MPEADTWQRVTASILPVVTEEVDLAFTLEPVEGPASARFPSTLAAALVTIIANAFAEEPAPLLDAVLFW